MQKASLLPSKVPMVDRRRKEHGKKGSRPLYYYAAQTAGLMYTLARSYERVYASLYEATRLSWFFVLLKHLDINFT